MQWLCLFAVLLALSQPAEAGRNLDAVLASVNESNARVLEKLAKVQEAVISQCTAMEVVKESEYIGCYEDKGERLLPTSVDIADLTNQKCVDACKEKGYQYAGTEYSLQCFCGNCYDRYPKKSESDCNYKCAGDQEKLCGGFWRISVYSTGN